MIELPEFQPDFGPVRNTIYVAYVSSHPTPKMEPALRRIAREPGIDLTVYYSDAGVQKPDGRTGDRQVRWEMPLLQGYKYKVLASIKLGGTAWSGGYMRQFLAGRYDLVWLDGPLSGNSVHALLAARMTRAKTLVRTSQRVDGALLRRLMDASLPARLETATGDVEAEAESEVKVLWTAIHSLGLVGRRPF